VTQEPKPKLSLDRSNLLLSALADVRRRTLGTLRDLPESQLDAVPPGGGSTIGAILYHIAIVEGDWLYDEILGTIDTDYPRDLFPVEMREDGTLLSSFTGESLAQHLGRLEAIRTRLVDVISAMSSDDLHEFHEREQYDVTPAWVVHHLMQHEAEHRSQLIGTLERLT
jgi:uncharacterized damage-inducible protein DinB